jgi:predicted transcriptional regulator of viral defense system
MKTIKAITLSLGEIKSPVITQYHLGLLIYKLFKLKEYKGEPVGLQKTLAQRRDFNKYLNQLLNEGVLSSPRGLPGNVYTLLGGHHGEAEEVACATDPFCYMSHLSAMSFHGLTDRIPAKLFLSSPGPTQWKAYAVEKMKKDLDDEDSADYTLYCENGLPKLTKIKMEKIGKVEIHQMHSKHLGAYKNIRDSSLRVSTIGRTFLEMLRNPELCGGINHVLEVFDEYAKTYLRLITDEIDANGNAIDKVRAGYIISERLEIDNKIVSGWAEFAQRGGSRKLDPSGEYMPVWSDTWCLSLNIFEKRSV